ncbi:signal recognition particle-docking protein FtsY [bacterium]|nr:signal recognition particle-docking protein FtsY [bacterium]
MADRKQKWNAGLRKSRTGFLNRIASVFRSGRVDDSLLDELEEVLIEADLGVDTALALVDKVRSGLDGCDDPRTCIRRILKSEISGIVAAASPEERLENPRVILVVGVNGTGKTTTIGKLAVRYAAEGKKVVLAGADTFRAAAAEQLEEWGQRAKVHVVLQKTGSDPAAVAYDALDSALARNADILLVDTAGRLHTKVNLMEELKKIRRVLDRRMPGAPHEVLLVIDATTGQNGLSQARLFSDAVGVTDIALTKLDGSARGGIVVSVFNTLQIPIKWAGLGEGMDDLVPFDPEAFVDGFFGE